jgi:hypothetical protein
LYPRKYDPILRGSVSEVSEMFPSSLKLIPQGQHPAGLRLMYLRGETPRATLCFVVRIGGSSGIRRRSSGASLDNTEGIIVIERGVKRSTERGMLYLGFLNEEGTFWGDEWDAGGAKSFQVYVYLPEEMFDRLADFARAGQIPEITVEVGEQPGLAGANDAQGIAVWDSQAHPSVKLESVRVDFALMLNGA